MSIPIMGLTCAAAELIEQCIISYCKKVFGCANQRPEGPSPCMESVMRGLQIFGSSTDIYCYCTVPDFLREMRNTCMIQCATLQLCTHGSVDIRTFATSDVEGIL